MYYLVTKLLVTKKKKIYFNDKTNRSYVNPPLNKINTI